MLLLEQKTLWTPILLLLKAKGVFPLHSMKILDWATRGKLSRIEDEGQMPKMYVEAPASIFHNWFIACADIC